MDPDHFKPILLRDKAFLESLYQSSSAARSKNILKFSSDTHIKTLIMFLHLLSSGQISISKKNFEQLQKRHLKIFTSKLEAKAAIKRLLSASREEKLKTLFKLVPVLPALLHTLFNED